MNYKSTDEVLAAILAGDINPYEGQVYIANQSRNWNSDTYENPWLYTAEQEKALNNLISQYNSEHSTIWQAKQLQALGLSNAGVLRTGGVNTSFDASNQTAIERDSKLHAQTQIASSLINMVGNMVAAGIRGPSVNYVKGSAGQAASLSAHTAMNNLRRY